ncbi:MAG: NAD(P)/FAD-dependent oxidoreductase [Clostridia bacterium]|nr:NAD(P)/FAD-dependent oxidoreductase [Clostridia bacterium]
MNEYIIIGNGVAAVGCIEGVRSQDAEGRITVISKERHPVYCRPLISYYLEGKTDLSRMPYRDEDFYEKSGCRVLYGLASAQIDPAKQTVTTDDGKTLSYTSVCVATGSSPFVPPIAGLDTVPDKFSFMTLDDALALEEATQTPKRVLIVGAGLIGLKCAEGLHARAASITVCDLADHVLPSILDADCASILQSHLEQNGIRFMLSDTVERFDGCTAHMRSGGTVDFDVLVMAVGVRANTALAKGCGCETNRGVLVGDNMETTVSGIYAAGDCTEGTDASCGQKRVLAILPNAYMQGFTAGVNMAGGTARFDNAIPMNAISFFGLHVMTAGTYDGELYEEKTDGGCKKLYTKDDLLKGFILIGDTTRAGLYTSLIRERTSLQTINFELMKKVATSAAYSSEKRKRSFGGVV